MKYYIKKNAGADGVFGIVDVKPGEWLMNLDLALCGRSEIHQTCLLPASRDANIPDALFLSAKGTLATLEEIGGLIKGPTNNRIHCEVWIKLIRLSVLVTKVESIVKEISTL